MVTESMRKPTIKYLKHPLLETPYPCPKHVTQENFDDALSYKAAAEDVFLCTYPKCGTTWVLHALFIMKNGGKPLAEGQNLFHMFPFLEMGRKCAAEKEQDQPKIIKTHLYCDLTPWNPEAKYIFVARNPKDCFVSFFYHTVGFDKLYDFADGTFNEYFESIIDGKVNSGDYFKCVPEWWEKSRTESNVLFMLYEDIKEDPKREFLKLADFIGPEWGRKVRENDNELLTKMVEESSFKKMSNSDRLLPTRIKRPENLPFVRKGIVGDWKNLFSVEQSQRVDERMLRTAKMFPGFDRLWERHAKHLNWN